MIQLFDTGVYLIRGRELVAVKHNASATMQHLLGRSVSKKEASIGGGKDEDKESKVTE